MTTNRTDNVFLVQLNGLHKVRRSTQYMRITPLQLPQFSFFLFSFFSFVRPEHVPPFVFATLCNYEVCSLQLPSPFWGCYDLVQNEPHPAPLSPLGVGVNPKQNPIGYCS